MMSANSSILQMFLGFLGLWIVMYTVESRAIGCVLQSVQGTRNQFTVHMTAYGASKVFYCANGTVFNQELCVCVRNDDPTYVPTAPPPRTLATRRPTRPRIPTTRPPCTFRPDVDRQYYLENVHMSGWKRRPCAYGTLFNEEECMCVDRAPIINSICRPELWLDFDSLPIKDVAGTNIYVENDGVDSVVKSGMFDKQGRLRLPLFSWIGDKLTITFRFYEFPGGDKEQTLIANCYDSRYGSLEVMMKPDTSELIFRIDTNLSDLKEMRIPYPPSSWKNVTVTYDGSYFKARVNNEVNSLQVKGNVEQRSEGFYIGQCPISGVDRNKRAYVGYIDDLKYHRCVQNGNDFSPPGYVNSTPQ